MFIFYFDKINPSTNQTRQAFNFENFSTHKFSTITLHPHSTFHYIHKGS